MVTPSKNNCSRPNEAVGSVSQGWKRKNNGKQYALTLVILKKMVTVPSIETSLSVFK